LEDDAEIALRGRQRRDIAAGLPDAAGAWMSRPAIARSSVVLPAARGPKEADELALLDSSETSFSAWKVPKDLLTFAIWR